ncbi:hypothetical protein ACWDRX_14530, partial [Streptomyces nigra]
MSDQNEPDPLDSFDEIIAEETDRDPDLAVIEAGSRTLRTQGGPPQADVPARPEDPEVDKALREVEAELATRWGETKLEPSVSRIAALMDLLGEPQRSYPSIHITGTNGKTSTARMVLPGGLGVPADPRQIRRAHVPHQHRPRRVHAQRDQP